MSYRAIQNPTALRVGMSGQLAGRHYMVLGRVVVATPDGYDWQEFHLGTTAGDEAVLVYERGDWKLFTFFEPAKGIAAREAALLRADEVVTLDERTFVISYVGRSRVLHVEGTPPEGVDEDDRAAFFNAEGYGVQVVVSWTGDEVEYYEGRDLDHREVERAFGLPRRSWWGHQLGRLQRAATDVNLFSADNLIAALVIGAVLLVVGGTVLDSIPDAPLPQPLPKLSAPVSYWPRGAEGTLAGRHYTVAAHALVEIGRPGQSFDRHEYLLTDDAGGSALLVDAPSGNHAEYALFRTDAAAPKYSPYDAAKVRVGRARTVADRQAEVTYLFRSRLLARDGVDAPDYWSGRVQYGFLAKEADHDLMVRWTETDLFYLTGRRLSEEDVLAAFRPKR